jgi:hypothetical protein
MSLIVFGIHLVFLGYFVWRSGYVQWILENLLFIAGLGWMVAGSGSYILQNANLDFTFITAFGEVFFIPWLWIRGQQSAHSPRLTELFNDDDGQLVGRRCWLSHGSSETNQML